MGDFPPSCGAQILGAIQRLATEGTCSPVSHKKPQNIVHRKFQQNFTNTINSERKTIMENHIQQDQNLPIDRKMLLTIREAAQYSNIGINKIDAMLKQPNCPFVLYVGNKKLVKRAAFEAYIDGKVAI